MKIYNYQIQHPDTNATFCISVRTADGEAVAEAIAMDSLAIALDTRQIDWYVEDYEVEDF